MAQIRIGQSIVDLQHRTIERHGRRATLEPRAAAVLQTLMDQRGSAVSRATLLDTCWGEGVGSDEALTQVIAQLRKALGEDGRSQAHLRTIPKAGYVLAWDEADAVDVAPIRRPIARWIAIGLVIAAAAGIVLLGFAIVTGRSVETRKIIIKRPSGTSVTERRTSNQPAIRQAIVSPAWNGTIASSPSPINAGTGVATFSSVTVPWLSGRP